MRSMVEDSVSDGYAANNSWSKISYLYSKSIIRIEYTYSDMKCIIHVLFGVRCSIGHGAARRAVRRFHNIFKQIPVPMNI